ncbi:MAG: hypothetical protein EOO12_06630 [Chitinophagaceae bacterium]|nr:MAG: hypothetical protein EOO12_06630 [Chitinophagaceae bacterium]
MFRLLPFLCLLLTASASVAQTVFGISGFATGAAALQQQATIDARPKEVLFGIHFKGDDVVFQLTSENWFRKIFSGPGDALTADLVPRARLECGAAPLAAGNWYRGVVLKPVPYDEMLRTLKRFPDGTVEVRIGPVPPSLRGQELEGNLVILRNREVSFYRNFTHLDQSLWELLDMGLYTDSLLRNGAAAKDGKPFFFSRKATVVIPFRKGAARFAPADIAPLYDSLSRGGQRVRKVSIRAFSSVEGALAANLTLQRQRGQSIAGAIQSFQKDPIRTELSSGENWVEFVQALPGTPFAYLAGLPKAAVKQRLQNRALLDSLEYLLAAQRKAVVTLYLDQDEGLRLPADSLLPRFRQALGRARLDEAGAIQREVFSRVADNHLPEDFLSRLEIPAEKPYSRLLNDQVVYRQLLREISEDEALLELRKIEQLDPSNMRVQYNIAALLLRLWQYNEKAADRNDVAARIARLRRLGTPAALVDRMEINSRIVLCEILMRQEKFAEKDILLEEVKNRYIRPDWPDNDLLSIGRYFCHYAQYQWADELIAPRMERVDVDADLLFFYINLAFFTGHDFEEDEGMRRILLNAESIDNARVCGFFRATGRGGISMQLLLEPFWKSLYCENCARRALEKSL